MYYWFAYNVLKLLSKILLNYRVYGRENVPDRGAFVFAGNHISNLDPVLLGVSIRRKISYMAKDSLFRNKLFGFILKIGNAFPVRRGATDISAMKEALKRLKSGCPLMLFPEGTRTLDKNKRKIRPGIGFIVAKSGVPVVPVKITGSDKALPPGARFVNRSPIEIVIGKPMMFSSSVSYEEIALSVVDAIDSIPSPR